jgi:hypothetical protein
MLSQRDKDLLEQARSIIRERFKQGWHHVGAALRTCSGKPLQPCISRLTWEELPFVLKLLLLAWLRPKATQILKRLLPSTDMATLLHPAVCAESLFLITVLKPLSSFLQTRERGVLPLQRYYPTNTCASKSTGQLVARE